MDETGRRLGLFPFYGGGNWGTPQAQTPAWATHQQSSGNDENSYEFSRIHYSPP